MTDEYFKKLGIVTEKPKDLARPMHDGKNGIARRPPKPAIIIILRIDT